MAAESAQHLFALKLYENAQSVKVDGGVSRGLLFRFAGEKRGYMILLMWNLEGPAVPVSWEGLCQQYA